LLLGALLKYLYTRGIALAKEFKCCNCTPNCEVVLMDYILPPLPCIITTGKEQKYTP
jgi:hypothetical protein